LDKGILLHYEGKFAESNSFFEKADKLIDHLYTKSISKAVLSVIGNDNATDYSGEDYENIYLNIFKALNYIELGNNESAMVEVRRIHDKLKLFKIKYQKEIAAIKKKSKKKSKVNFGEYNFYDSAMARYLSMLLYRADEEFSDAEIDKKNLLELLETNSHIYRSANMNFSDFRTELPVDSGIVNFMAFVGHGPKKYPWELDVQTFKDKTFIAGNNPKFSRQLYFSLDPNLGFKISIPRIVRQKSRIQKINVSMNGNYFESLELLEDMGSVAENTFKMNENKILIKSILRSSLKALAANEASKKIKKEVKNEILGDLLAFGSRFAMASTEYADIRGWRLIPGNCYVGEAVLPFGQHKIKIDYIGKSGKILFSEERKVVLNEDKTITLVNTYAF
jgi:hypothetical protein